MPPLVAERAGEIWALGRRYGVRRLDLFGSAATGAFRAETSDVDVVADDGGRVGVLAAGDLLADQVLELGR